MNRKIGDYLKQIILVVITLLAISTSQAQERYQLNRGEQILNTVTNTVHTACVFQQVASTAVGWMAGLFLPSEAKINVYVKLPSGKKVRINKRLLRLKDAMCPFILEGLQRFR